MSLEQIDTPPDDGRTIDGTHAVLDRPVEAIPISKLPIERQFTVLQGHLRADAEHSREWRVGARDAFAFRAGDQWTAEDRALLDGQSRPHIVFNRVLTILKAVAGMEINGRHEIHYIPVNTEDTEVNETLSGASKWMAEGCDAEDEESQAFDQCSTTGMGWVEERMSYVKNSAGLYIEEMVDCREMYWDRKAKKKNVADARRLSRARRMSIGDAMAMFPGRTREQLDATWFDDSYAGYPLKSIEEKRNRNDDSTFSDPYDDQCEVMLIQTQWIENEIYWIVADNRTNTRAEIDDAGYRRLEERAKLLGMNFQAVRMVREAYKSAWLGGELLKPAGNSPIKGAFSWNCITGEYDAVKGTWFGLVHVMRDPQMWANKWLSQILHILNTTAKGGILAEESAFADQVEAENTYARPDSITVVADGALSGDKPKIMPKPGTGISDGYLGLMTFAISSIKDVTGINLELLGQQDQNQPGIIEAMRKQAGMTVLATLFDSLRRFRKMVGRSRLFFIQNFLSDGRLIRVVGPEHTKAVRLAKDATTGEYDVIVDDTPTSPNQKEANWAIIQPLLGLFKDQLMANPQVFAMLLEYSPLPSRIVSAIKGFVDQAQNNPQAQQEAEVKKKLAIGQIVAGINKDQSVAELNNKKAGATEATAMYDVAMAKNLLEKNNIDGLKGHLDLMEAAAKTQHAEATAQNLQAKTNREIVGTHLDVAAGHAQAAQAATDAHGAIVGRLIEHLSAKAGAHRDMAAAHKDHVAAAKNAMTPIAQPSSAGVQ